MRLLACTGRNNAGGEVTSATNKRG